MLAEVQTCFSRNCNNNIHQLYHVYQERWTYKRCSYLCILDSLGNPDAGYHGPGLRPSLTAQGGLPTTEFDVFSALKLRDGAVLGID